MQRNLIIWFGTGGAQKQHNFDEIESGCTEAQVLTFAQACSSIVGSSISEFEIHDVVTLRFGSGANE